MRLVFLGPPGAGKGTQAARMAQKFSLVHASTGDIFRQAIAEDTDLGRQVKEYLDSGRLVPDELTSRVVEQMVVDKCQDFILDGYPRTLQQARDLEAMLQRRGQALDAVVYFALDDEVATRRLTGRLVCPNCKANYHREFMAPKQDNVCDACGAQLTVRSDSTPEVVEKRLREYHQKTRPLVALYRQQGLLRTVDAAPPPEQVEQATEALLRSLREGSGGA